jgi:hypothetical protein
MVCATLQAAIVQGFKAQAAKADPDGAFTLSVVYPFLPSVLQPSFLPMLLSCMVDTLCEDLRWGITFCRLLCVWHVFGCLTVYICAVRCVTSIWTVAASSWSLFGVAGWLAGWLQLLSTRQHDHGVAGPPGIQELSHPTVRSPRGFRAARGRRHLLCEIVVQP